MQLTSVIEETHNFFLSQVQRQVNIALTLRNWLIGYYVVEYEQNGTDRAEYGKAVIKNLSLQLKQRKLKGFSEIALRTNRSFYLAYPQIQQTLSVEFQYPDNKLIIIQQTLSVESKTEELTYVESTQIPNTNAFLLMNRLSFSHFIELLKTEDLLKRLFYETEAINSNWTVRELQRAMNSMLFERTGLSINKQEVILKQISRDKIEAKGIPPSVASLNRRRGIIWIHFSFFLFPFSFFLFPFSFFTIPLRSPPSALSPEPSALDLNRTFQIFTHFNFL